MKQRGRYNKVSSQIVDTNTGEILDLEDVKRAFEDDLTDYAMKTTRETSELGVGSNIRVIKDKLGEPYEVLNVKEDHEFNKIFRVDVRYVFENSNLSPESFAFIGRFSCCLHFPSNTVMLNGVHPTQDEMSEAMGVGRTKLNNALKELEFYDVVKRKKINGKTYIYFNPFLYSTGITAVDTYKIFRESIYNPKKSADDSGTSNNKEEITPNKWEKSGVAKVN